MNHQDWRNSQILVREAVHRRRASEIVGPPAPSPQAASLPARGGVGEAPSGASAEGTPLVSVVVVCWNAAGVVGRCLEHLFAQRYPSFEIVVVDDGSSDDTAGIVQAASQRGPLTLVSSPRNRGCPNARNIGIRHANGEIIAFLDADGFAAPNWLGRVVAGFAADPAIGAIASTVFFDDNPLVINGAGGIVNRQGWAADLTMNESYETAQIASEALYPMGCGMAVRRAAIERVGPFDDRMLNYYDDVDYGVRLWRAGYRVAVTDDAWVDHGFGAAGGDSARKRLLCERHRMRVVLKHASVGTLARWVRWEARSLRAASIAERAQKLRSAAWNARHLPSLLAGRRRLLGEPAVPPELVDASWGDGFPAGVPSRLRPIPERSGAAVDMGDPDSGAQLLHGWFPPERAGERSYRWAATCAAAFVHLAEPARCLRLDYAHVPVDIGGVDVSVRRVGSSDPLRAVWGTRLLWQYIARSVENHPLALEPGDYEVLFSAACGWSDPPLETRSLALALSSLSFESSLEIAWGGLDMASSTSEGQLVKGWFEAEESPDRRYRWATGRAVAVVRLAEHARSVDLDYRLPPRPVGALRIVISPLWQADVAWSTSLEWRDAEWHQETLALDLPPGDYLLSFETDATWSNPQERDPALWGENRSLGFALSALSFGSRSLR